MQAQDIGLSPQMTEFLWSLSLRVPVVLMMLIGIVWAMMNWNKAPTSAMLAVLACLLVLLSSCIFPAVLAWVPSMMIRPDQPDPMSGFRWAIRAIIGAWNAFTAVCLGLLIFAVFAGRGSQAQRNGRPFGEADRDDDRPSSPASGSGSSESDDRIKAS